MQVELGVKIIKDFIELLSLNLVNGKLIHLIGIKNDLSDRCLIKNDKWANPED